MIDPFVLAGIVLGVGCTLTYVLFTLRKRGQVNLGDGVHLFIAGAAITVGIKVCVLALSPRIVQLADGERTYVFLGGMALVWVSVETIIKKFCASP